MKFTYSTEQEIINSINIGDLLKIEYYSVREDKRVTRLFEVTLALNSNQIIQVDNSRMYFVIRDNKFIEEEYEPVIKAWIPKKELDKITINLINLEEKNSYIR